MSFLSSHLSGEEDPCININVDINVSLHDINVDESTTCL